MCSGAISVLCIVVLSFSFISQPKVAYIRVGYVYDNFEYKKELEAKLTNVVQYRKTMLDSMALQLNILSKSIESSPKKDDDEIKKFEDGKQKYLMKKQEFDEDNDDVKKKYAGEIMKQMNQYVEDYGKANGYAFIYGAEGNGTIMSADNKYDITSKVVQYVNERYKGKN
jgi:outer membrane protein